MKLFFCVSWWIFDLLLFWFWQDRSFLTSKSHFLHGLQFQIFDRLSGWRQIRISVVGRLSNPRQNPRRIVTMKIGELALSVDKPRKYLWRWLLIRKRLSSSILSICLCQIILIWGQFLLNINRRLKQTVAIPTQTHLKSPVFFRSLLSC